MKIFQESNNLVIKTAEGKGDMLINGRSLKGLFATVADLDDDVNAMTTVSALVPLCAGGSATCARLLVGVHTCTRPVGVSLSDSQKPQPT